VTGALILAGCGGSSGGGSSGTTTSANTGGSETSSSEGATGGAKFEISEEDRQCLKEKGVELPEFKGGEGPPQGGENGEMPGPPEGGELPQGGEPPEGFEPPEGGEMPQGGFGESSKAFEECGIETPE